MRKIKVDCGRTCQFPSDGGCASFWLTANPEVILLVVPRGALYVYTATTTSVKEVGATKINAPSNVIVRSR